MTQVVDILESLGASCPDIDPVDGLNYLIAWTQGNLDGIRERVKVYESGGDGKTVAYQPNNVCRIFLEGHYPRGYYPGLEIPEELFKEADKIYRQEALLFDSYTSGIGKSPGYYYKRHKRLKEKYSPEQTRKFELDLARRNKDLEEKYFKLMWDYRERLIAESSFDK